LLCVFTGWPNRSPGPGEALALTADLYEAGRRAAGEARAALGDVPLSFAALFASAHFLDSAEAVLAAVAEQTGPLPLIGCVAEAVAGGPARSSPSLLFRSGLLLS
jgi:small ligand-binding sensory domain FIST